MKNQSQNLNRTPFDSFSNEIENTIHTTNSQLEIWTDCMIGSSDANKAYNLSFTIKLKGKLIFNAFEYALNTLVFRHECLRANFSTDGKYMNIYKNLKIEISHNNISQLSAIEKEKSKEIIIDEEVNSLFDLVKGPLFKVKFIKIDELENLLILTYHHIIGDGLSINIILEELSLLYSSFINKTEPKLTTPERFSEYAEKVNSLKVSNEYKQIEDFWISIYKESVPIIQLPIDYSRPPLRTYNSQRLDLPIDPILINSLKQLGNSTDSSLTTTLLAAFEVFLSKLTGQKELVIGSPISGNRRYDMRYLIGDCANLLPLRSTINTNISFIEYLKQRNPQLIEAYLHHQVSFGHLLQKLDVVRDPSRVPMVPITLTVDLNHGLKSEYSFFGLTHEFKINPRKYSSFELQLHVFRSEKSPVFQCSYNSTLFKEETIKQILISFEETLNKLIAIPNTPLKDLFKGDYLANYISLNNTDTPYPNISLSELLSQQAEISPQSIAIEYNGTKISYQDLHIKVNQFAHYLVAQGVQSGDYIAVSYPRSPELVYSILAIIQCGAAYLPLDHEYPIKRVEFMMEDSQAKFLLTSKALSLSLPKCSNTILIDDAMASLHQYPATKLQRFVNPENILYLLYTSGSTGKPKGAKISNKNVVNLLSSFVHEPGINESDRIPFISTISFDIASFELFFPLIKGATLVLPDHETSSDGRLLYEMLEKEKITLVVGTPTTYQMLIDAGWSKKLPLKILCCGEPLPTNLAKELINRCDELWNLYGPTEVTIFSSCKHIKNEETLISVGGPIANMQYYIVDEHMNLLPPNAIGEIAIGGFGVGKGYLGRPELTAAKFIPNKFSNKKDDIMYLSGDIGKLLPTNEVVCLGRIDHQVKIRGHRIEIGEIENALMSLDGIKSAVVLAKSDLLIAFIIADSDVFDDRNQISIWRNELASQLPIYMVPHNFHIIDKMPTTLNDKIDRKVLLEYKSDTKNKQEYTAPRTNEEKLVATIWQECFNLENIDIFSTFFEMGGHSILAVNIMIKIENETGKRIPLSALFEHSTVEKFAKLLNIENDIPSDYLVPIKPNGSKIPLFIIHGGGLNIINFAHAINHLDDDQPVYGFQGIGPNGFDNWFESIESMAACYLESIIKINPKGPYALAGFSFGGIVAFEIARQLKDQGKTVSIIAALDTYVDSSYYSATPIQKGLARYYDRTYRRLVFLKEILTSWESLKLRFSSKKEYLLKKYFGQNNNMTKQELIALEKFIEADGMVNKIVNRYQLIPQDFEVDLFRAKDDKEYKLDPGHLGWKKAALKGVNIHNITGNHLSIVEPPNDKILAGMLQNLLDKRHINF
ncbi:non-ribosomal peptide synthetase [Flavobacterium cellulosilyticum]|uniref:Amino acid adenylation domain-containing protein n=1 Tax=Flavobacterium cellulosilyticum TaxID=2541731 RepID=A0A4V2YZJ6_9FLAO|nr:non-ribosomal peptide synthetase [Flavobacterium cellulosilyticum]TDD97457.1 amino acid adenylation domain-containing protein [Flavobacterium cellulosilyticum]